MKRLVEPRHEAGCVHCLGDEALGVVGRIRIQNEASHGDVVTGRDDETKAIVKDEGDTGGIDGKIASPIQDE